VMRTPVSYASEMTRAARPIAIDNSRELIERGLAREAAFWLVVTAARAQQVLERDGSPMDAARHASAVRALLDDLGVGSCAQLADRAQRLRAYLPRLWQVAEAILDAGSRPKIYHT
jgi:hypothetical protein